MSTHYYNITIIGKHGEAVRTQVLCSDLGKAVRTELVPLLRRHPDAQVAFLHDTETKMTYQIDVRRDWFNALPSDLERFVGRNV